MFGLNPIRKVDHHPEDGKLAVQEVFYTIQGEGPFSGVPAVFVRLAGCHLACTFCDTEFESNIDKRYTPTQVAELAWATTRPSAPLGLVVLTGGEPLLQVDEALVDALHAHGFTIAVETNGTVLPPKGIDWLCMSPKAGSQRVVAAGQELKLVFPQVGAEPALYESLNFEHFYLQPMDGPHAAANTAAAVAYCQAHPRWRLSVQTHKLIGIR